MGYKIAIDGPAGAGKSTIAKAAAKKLAFVYIDTGAMYRAMALYFSENGIDLSDRESVAAACQAIRIDIAYEDGRQQILLQGENVTARIRTEQIGTLASQAAQNADVRKKLSQLQRELAEKTNVVMDGRDIGTVVLPDAELKIFLTASVETRASRRYKELTERGDSCNIEEIEKNIRMRDEQDMHREIAPLTQAEDAVYLDSSHMSIEEVTEKILSLYRGKTP